MRATGSQAMGSYNAAKAGDHPDLERWIAYHDGGTAETEHEALQEHLEQCKECTDLVLDLAAFDEPKAEGHGVAVSEFERATAWRALKPHLRTKRSWHVPASLAASFLVAALGISGWFFQQSEIGDLRQQVAELSQPQANVPIHDLYLGTTLRGPGLGTELEVSSGSPRLTLILNELVVSDETESLRALVIDASGRVVATVDGLELDEMGVATLGLARETLTSGGDYVIRVEASREGGWFTIGDYPLRLSSR